MRDARERERESNVYTPSSTAFSSIHYSGGPRQIERARDSLASGAAGLAVVYIACIYPFRAQHRTRQILLAVRTLSEVQRKTNSFKFSLDIVFTPPPLPFAHDFTCDKR